MESKQLNIVFLGLSITSSWGNGHATTFRSLIKGLYQKGHMVTFLERDVPWYANQRDMAVSPYCSIFLYSSLEELRELYSFTIENADCVIVGSYVPQGGSIGHWVQNTAMGITAFYDIDTPVTLSKLAAKDYEYLSPDLVPGYDLYLSFTGGPTLTFIENELNSPRAEPLYCSFDSEIYYPETFFPKRWDLGYMGTYSSDRQPALEELLINVAELLPDKKFVVAGPQYPRDIQWPKNVERIPHLPPDKHREFYNSQHYTLNLTRSDMKIRGYSPSVRLFEAAACGTPIISDYWEGIDNIFQPGKEILIAKSSKDIVDILSDKRPTKKESIGKYAWAKVIAKHTSLQRANQLEDYILSEKYRKRRLQNVISSKTRNI